MFKIKLTEAQIKKYIINEISKITAYHGSNANFDEFDLGYVNTGNKMQAYGYGIYVALSPEAAEHYGKIKYIVEIPKSETKYLDGYKRYKKDFVLKIFKKLYEYLLKIDDIYKGGEKELWDEISSIIDDYDGLTIYGTAETYLGSDKEASLFFDKLGFYGLKWVDNGNLNAVIFNPKNINIIKKEKPIE